APNGLLRLRGAQAVIAVVAMHAVDVVAGGLTANVARDFQGRESPGSVRRADGDLSRIGHHALQRRLDMLDMVPPAKRLTSLRDVLVLHVVHVALPMARCRPPGHPADL